MIFGKSLKTCSYIIVLMAVIAMADVASACAAGYSREIEALAAGKKLSTALAALQDTIDKSTDNEKSLAAAQKYMQLAESAGIKQYIARAYHNLGVDYWQVANHIKASEYLFKAIELSSELKDTAAMIDNHIYMGLVYTRDYDWKMTEKYYKEAYRLAVLFKNDFLIASSSWNMAYINCIFKRKETALSYARDALEHLARLDQNAYLTRFGYGLTNLYIGMAYSEAGIYDAAVNYYRLAIEWNKKIGNLNMLAQAYSCCTAALNGLGKYDDAIDCGTDAVRLSRVVNNYFYLAKACEQLAKAWENKKRPGQALEYYKLLKLYSDSLYKYDSRAEAAKTELNNAEIQFRKESEYRKARTSYVLVIGGIILLGLAGAAVMLYSKYKMKSRLSAELKESNATKDKFFEIIAHDLRSPLAGLYSLSNTLCRYYGKMPEKDKIGGLQSMKETADSLMSLTENLLGWARLQSNRITICPGEFDIYPVVEREKENMANSARKKNIEIVNKIERNTVIVADDDMISAVVRNLLSNAVKFTKENGRIEIDGEAREHNFIIGVKDNGVGIRKDYSEKIFNVSSRHSTRGTANEKGTGLGLSLCKDFVEKNNGRIWFESEPGIGSKFYISLPMFQNNDEQSYGSSN